MSEPRLTRQLRTEVSRMHMSDALLSPAVGLGFHGASAALLASAARRAAREPGYERRLPLMGVLGAFVFAAQMVNFAIPGTGSSGHLTGGLLLALLLGPSAAFLVLVSVLTVQALFFGDGGLLALGCNAFNLGFWPCLVGAPLQRWLAGGRVTGARAAVACVAAAVLSLELGALGAAVQTSLSGRADVSLAHLAALVAGIHLPIGVVEGLVTTGVVALFARVAPDRTGADSPVSATPLLAVALGCALFLATGGAALASQRPDGLEWSLLHALGPAHGAVAEARSLASGAAGTLLAAAVVLVLGGVGLVARRSRGRAAKAP